MKVTEQNFLYLLRRKKEKALLYVIEHYGWVIKTVLARQLVHLPDGKEECQNDVLFAIWKHADQYDEKRGSFENWIAGITRFCAIDYKRKYLKNPKMLEIDSLEDQEQKTPLENILQEELKAEIREILTCLNETDQNIFIKYYLDEWKAEEISELTGLSQSVIYNHLSRGRKKIRKSYPGKGGIWG